MHHEGSFHFEYLLGFLDCLWSVYNITCRIEMETRNPSGIAEVLPLLYKIVTGQQQCL